MCQVKLVYNLEFIHKINYFNLKKRFRRKRNPSSYDSKFSPLKYLLARDFIRLIEFIVFSPPLAPLRGSAF
jgi:hypothetical protein